MKERPILWSAPMVLALLAGRKTQTRRIVKPQPEQHSDGMWSREPDLVGHFAEHVFGACFASLIEKCGKPYARVGDRLWGRETFGATDLTLDDKHRPGIHYRATDDWPQRGPWPWRPSIFMPRWASRLLHEVTAVRVERLLDITAADAIAEGLEEVAGLGVPEYRWPDGKQTWVDPRDCYLAGWDSINGKGSAAKNPWVWVVSFKGVH